MYSPRFLRVWFGGVFFFTFAIHKMRSSFQIIFLFFFLGGFINSSNAQRLSQLLADGDKAMKENNYFSAAVYYNQAILQDSADINIQYKYADASRLNFDYNIAERWYGKVYKKDASGKQFPDCVFWLAMIKKQQGKYKEAKKMFDKYAKKNKKKKDDYLVRKANQEVAACDLAELLTASPDKSVNIVHLDTMVNSKVSEYAPIEVDSVLYFSSLRNTKDKDKKHNAQNKSATCLEFVHRRQRRSGHWDVIEKIF